MRLLEKMGASVNPANVEKILKEWPLEKALVMPVWARGSVVIFPGCADYRDSDKNELVEQMYKPKEVDAKARSKPSQEKSQSSVKGKGGGIKSTQGSGAIAAGARTTNPNTTTTTTTTTAAPKPDKVESKLEQLPKTQKGRRVSWSTVHTLDILGNKAGVEGDYPAILSAADMTCGPFLRLLEPPMFGEDDVQTSINLFCANLVDYSPRIKKDFSGKLFKTVKGLLTSPLSVRLYGLLCHYCYWNIMRPWARVQTRRAGIDTRPPPPAPSSPKSENEFAEDGDENASFANYDGGDDDDDEEEMSQASLASLAQSGKEQLFVQLEECLTALHKRMGFDAIALTTAHQSHVCGCHFVADELLSTCFSWLSQLSPAERRKQSIEAQQAAGAEPAELRALMSVPLEEDTSPQAKFVALRLRRLMHQALADILDPARIFTQHMLISSYVGEGEQKSIAPRNPAAKYFITSLAVRSVFGDAYSDKTRRFLGNTNEPYVPVPGVVVRAASAAAAQEAALAAHSRSTFKVKKPHLPLLSSASISSSTLVESPVKEGRGLPAEVPSTVPASKALPPPRALGFPSGGGGKVGGESAIKAVLKQSHQSRSALATTHKAEELARALTGRWEEQGVFANAAEKQARAEQQRLEQEHKRTEELARAQARAKPVDFFDIFGSLGWSEAAVRHGEPQHSHHHSVSSLPQMQPSASTASLREMAREALRRGGDDQSVHSMQSLESRTSIVHNPRAEMQVSLSAKATLMRLVTDRASSQYSKLASDLRPGLLLAPTK